MRFNRGLWIPILLTWLCLPTAGAGQQTDVSDQSVQPAAPVSSVGPAELPAESEAPLTSSDARSFLGAEDFTAGPPGRTRSYFSPSFQLSEMADSNFSLGTGGQEFETAVSLVGRLAFQKVGKHSQLTTDYLGGGSIYNRHSELNTTMHQLGISHSYQGRRWSFLLDERVTYLPESTFGFGGFGWMGALGSSLSGAFGSNLANLNPTFSPTGSLLTGRGSRVLSTSVAQVKYLTGPRSAITFAGSYGLLHFREPGLIDNRNAFSLVGYSRSLTARDYIGIDYSFGLFRFQDPEQRFESHFLHLSYGHRISGRMAIALAAGPQVNVFRTPIAGSAKPVAWTAQSSLDYRSRRGGVAISYARYTTGGGGALNGAITDTVRTAWSWQLTRKWSGSLSPGYAHNRSLPQTALGNIENTFDTVYAGASLSRALGRYMTMFLTYDYQAQRSEAIPCVAGNCGTSLGRHLLRLGFDWHPRQIMID